MKITINVLIAVLSIATSQSIFAGSAAWNLNPISSDWNTATNWTPATVPDGPADIATFDVSTITGVSIRRSVEVESIVFNAGASAYTIDNGNAATWTLSGAGIVNNSDITQNILIPSIDGSESIVFLNGATIGSNIVVTNNGYGGTTGADIEFRDYSNAGDVIINNNGFVFFFDHATAGRGTFINNPPRLPGLSPSVTYFSYFGFDGADRATFINNGGARPNEYGGATAMYSAGAFGKSTAINYGGTVAGAHGGFTDVGSLAHLEDVTFIAYGGTNGADGGSIQLGGAHADNAKVQIYGNSTLDVSLGRKAVIGSLEGEGTVFLGSSTLVVGADRDSVFTGIIQNRGGSNNDDGGGLVKSGIGRMVLRRASLYDGGTFVIGGELFVNNKGGSGTGTGPVIVKAGTLSGGGKITGAVTIGTGSGAGANLAPGRDAVTIATLTIESSITFNSDAAYSFGVNSTADVADSVAANGVTINTGAQFIASDGGNAVLVIGTTFTAINNTAATPMSGTFANLADGSTMTIGSNTYQADYEGGDGNDLTLTVVQ